MLPHTGLFLLWKVALQMRIRSLLDGSLSVVEPAPFDGVFKFSCPPSKAEPHHFARFLVDKDEKMAAQSDGFFIFGMLQFLWVDLFSDGLR